MFRFSPVPVEEWVHVAVNWNRDTFTSEAFLNGKHDYSTNATSNSDIDLMRNDHAVYDIGLKRDSGSASTFKGFLKELVIFGRALNEDEVNALKGIVTQKSTQACLRPRLNHAVFN